MMKIKHQALIARGLTALAILLILAIVLMLLCQWAWQPSIVVWTRNAHEMVQAGVWKGWDAVQAQVAYVFIYGYGRTFLVIGSALIWLLSAYFLTAWVINDWRHCQLDRNTI